jgi:hypothetical protein
MCDYSLGGLPNRLAVEGDELIVHRFRTGSMGLASHVELCEARRLSPCAPRKSIWQRIKSSFEIAPPSPDVPAVCVPPGAEMVLKDIPRDLQEQWNVTEEEGVFFLQISATVNSYRDAVLFHNGRRVLLQNLRAGIRARVVSLGGTPSGTQNEIAIPAL